MYTSLPQLGARLFLNSQHAGTIRYIGQVDGTNGDWLGVEWDDASRGRHSGVKDGKQYFACRIPGSGSFIRPTASVSYGASFLEALRSKYLEAAFGSTTQETVTLGSSNGSIIVEAVNLDKIRNKLSDLSHLKEVSFDSGIVSRADPPGEIQATCPRIRGLDLSGSLISKWSTLAEIARELPDLRRLVLNQNRFPKWSSIGNNDKAFTRVVELKLNRTFMDWSDFQAVSAAFPSLEILEMGYNSLTSLQVLKDVSPPRFSTLNLDSNDLHDWPQICEALRYVQTLERLILSANKIQRIRPAPSKRVQSLVQLQQLSLSFNEIGDWLEIDFLAVCCPGLTSLILNGNPITTNPSLNKNAKQFAVAKIPSLLFFDSVSISPRERVDCELFYLSYATREVPLEDRIMLHPQLERLSQLHGPPPEAAPTKQDKLKNSLISLEILVNEPLTGDLDQSTSNLFQTSIKVLPSMKTRILRLKICKTLRQKGLTFDDKKVQLWMKMVDGMLVQLNREQDESDLDWWGLEEGTNIVVSLSGLEE